jgi:hypothetical protein
MSASRRAFLLGTAAASFAAMAPARAATPLPAFTVTAPMDPPEWALLERELLDANTEACVHFFQRYFDQSTGYLETTERWGGDDGPDDAIENCNDWPLIYALGGGAEVKEMVEKAYEGHVRQYTKAKTTEVPFAKEGMYYKEFPTMMDWQHNGEGLTVFNLMGLMDPYNQRYRDRVRRFVGFYDGSDPGAPNYDPKLKLIKSMINGSRGPMLRKATALDWTGDPIDVKDRFPSLGHGEADYQQMLAHFQEYTDVVGDHPLNLSATTLGLNAYALAHEPRYKQWVLDYMDAWVERAKANNDILPSNVGRDGVIGSDADGKWWGGAYGWGFSPVVPQTGKREDRNRVVLASVAFLTAYMMSRGNDKYLDVWRKQSDRINAQMKVVDGKPSAPYMYNDKGWYGFRPGKYQIAALEIYYMSMKPSDRARIPENPWFDFLEGKNPGFPAKALRDDLARIRYQMQVTRSDTTSPDMRLADSALNNEPASVMSLMQCMEGGIRFSHDQNWSRTSPSIGGAPVFTRLRYFDPEARRPGIPKDVAALVQGMTADSVTVTFVNLNVSQPRILLVQGGSYAEHQILSVSDGKSTQTVDNSFFPLRLAPGAGAQLTIRMRRYANDPTFAFPWENEIADLGDTPPPPPRRRGE